MTELQRVAETLRSEDGRVPFDQLPDEPNVYYAVWVDTSGADDLSAASPDPIVAGIVYVGECVTQSPRRHLAVSGRDIGSLTLMKNLAALFRDDWTLRAERRGSTLREPGRDKLRAWMRDHLTATVAPRHPDVPTKELLALLDPPLRIEGWRPEKTDLRQYLTEQRARLDRD